jgi:hypothetical protein
MGSQKVPTALTECYWSFLGASFAGVVPCSSEEAARLGQWFLHHDNAPSHTSLVLQKFLAEKNIPVITQPPYTPDLAPSDFWLFPTLKMGLKGTHFASMEDIKSNATGELWNIPSEAFRRCFQQ